MEAEVLSAKPRINKKNEKCRQAWLINYNYVWQKVVSNRHIIIFASDLSTINAEYI
jgi:hypothetical protein